MRDQVSGFRGSSHGRAQVLGVVAQVARVSPQVLRVYSCSGVRPTLSGVLPKLREGTLTSRFQPSFGTSFHVSALCPKPCPTSARVLKHPKLKPQAKVLLGDTTPRLCAGNPFQPLYVFTYRQDFLPQGAGAHGGATCSTQLKGIGSGTSGGGCSRFRRSSAKQLFQELADF
jgi:hypothetical protein